MGLPSSHEVTRLLKAWSGGDEEALEKLTPLVYRQLHEIAQRYMAGERAGQRSLSTVDGLWKGKLAGPGSFLRRISAVDAAHPHRFCPLARLFEARRCRSSHFSGRSSVGMQ